MASNLEQRAEMLTAADRIGRWLDKRPKVDGDWVELGILLSDVQLMLRRIAGDPS